MFLPYREFYIIPFGKKIINNAFKKKRLPKYHVYSHYTTTIKIKTEKNLSIKWTLFFESMVCNNVFYQTKFDSNHPVKDINGKSQGSLE